MTTDCCCPLAGYCERHQVLKNKHWHALCRSEPSYFKAWENGKGPGQQTHTDTIFYSCQYNHWGPLHFYAVKNWDNWNERRARKWFRAWKRGVTGGCGCTTNFANELKAMPVDLSSARGFFEWAWKIHDSVNERLGKSYRPTLEESYRLWLPHAP